ncbi:N-acetyltransferase [Ochrobactrum sp. 30A/1000/2015]|nr:N-acetyltransferase [Ochrobactrum sp. 30A/1000/2015]PJT37398.1 N-acetyltransferase [Ochrobactrum sp. 27A/999/2015]PJT41342.1 N-acetyltransferase [Ochrobactrum sp. 23A/997/2015]
MDFRYEKFSLIDLEDVFFDSLRADYKGFDNWFSSKSKEGAEAYVIRDDAGGVQGFLYLKLEDEAHSDIEPALGKAKRVKVGTLKINAHGTRLGQRFVKKMVDWAINNNATELYVTIFEKHAPLISLLERYGFANWGTKNSVNGQELVLVKNIGKVSGDLEKDYPVVDASKDVYLLSIYPKFHTKLFPDSKLATESPDIIQDTSSSNSIHKIYLCSMKGVENLKRGDVLVIYRTADGGAAEYTAVATSLCVVEEIRSIYDFANEREFLDYALPYSVFSEAELKDLWKTKNYPKIIRFTYNVSLNKRPIRKVLIEDVGIDRNAYPGFLQMDGKKLKRIAELGKVDENIIVN